MITKSERYREILAVLTRHGIGVADDRFLKHEAAGQARAEHHRRACEFSSSVQTKNKREGEITPRTWDKVSSGSETV